MFISVIKMNTLGVDVVLLLIGLGKVALILSVVIPKSDHCPPFFFLISEGVLAVSRLLQLCSGPQEKCAGPVELDQVGDTFNM